MLTFSIPPELAAAVNRESGEVAFTGAARHVIRVGGAAGLTVDGGGINLLEGSLVVEAAELGPGAGRLVVLPAPPPRKSK